MIILYKILTFLIIGLLLTIFFWFFSKNKQEKIRNQEFVDSFEIIIVLTIFLGGIVSLFINEKYDDGVYCAKIHYYNPETETESNYELPIVVKNGKLVQIQWSNGGWLDESHFKAPKITDGSASFTSDRDYEYDVEILNKDDCNEDY